MTTMRPPHPPDPPDPTDPADSSVTAQSLATPLASLSNAEVMAAFRRLELDRRRLEGDVAALIGEIERRGAHRADGHRTVPAWCRTEGSWSTAEAVARTQLARLIARHPVIGGALRAGALGVAQAHLLARAAANPRIGDQIGCVLHHLLVDATTLPYDDFRRVVEHWERTVDVDGSHHSRRTGHAYRFARLRRTDGACELEASGGALDGAALQEIFDRYCDAEFQTDLHHAREHGVDIDADGLVALPRTARQRAFDALLRIFQDAAATAPGGAEAEPLVNIVVDAATLEQAIDALADDDATPGMSALPRGPVPRHWHSRSRDGAWIPPHDVLQAALAGRVRRVVTDDAGVVIDLGRRRRLFTGAARDAVMVLATHCAWPGCRVHHRLCQADHTTPHAAGGATEPGNGGPLCPHHNRWKQRGYRLWRDPAGVWHTYRPDGSEIGAQ